MNIGIDLSEITRFQPLVEKKNHSFLQKVFTKRELRYCFKYKDSAKHLAGTFAAKEAISKACGVNKYPFITLEIRHTGNGALEAWCKNRKISAAISISYTKELAAAVALCNNI